ncbi:MAG: L-seryl-tRNA(Sec) selenium transferase [Deltaproteobacteria bacterium]|nr:L-seryl-tRNA(Sec) selenium transferase [Deltaproteobacteria bacterium]
MNDTQKALLKTLPKIDGMMQNLEKENIFERAPKDVVKEACRTVVENLRYRIMKAENISPDSFQTPKAEDILADVTAIIDALHQYHLKRVINATGVILHTNLGRAPLCDEAVRRLSDIGAGYSNLEYNLKTGRRGLRYDHVQRLLCVISGAQDALVVNNNAAAVLLVLNTLADGKDVIVSRGELIEIGGEFRIPEIMEKSGAILHEVGTTNRTHLADYEKAIHENTGLILKVHTSNYKILGFTEEIDLFTLVALGKRFGIPVFNDLGSGCFLELDQYGLIREPTVQDALATGADVVTLSGDKLLGGPQAGIILGKKALLQDIKKNALNRALRIDKLTLAALEATLMLYLNPETARSRSRVLRALTDPVEQVEKKARKLLAAIRRLKLAGIHVSLRKGISRSGGGSLPMEDIPTFCIALTSDRLSCHMIDEHLRRLDIPVIVRIADDEVLMDLRTIDDKEFSFIIEGLKTVTQEKNQGTRSKV